MTARIKIGCEATPIDLGDEPKESCTGTRRTETYVAPGHAHVDASHGALPSKVSLSSTRPVFHSVFDFFLCTSSVVGREVRCKTFSFLCSFFLFNISHAYETGGDLTLKIKMYFLPNS